jgi:hypothetical protein
MNPGLPIAFAALPRSPQAAIALSLALPLPVQQT